MGRPTITTLAKMFGVSKMTISRVINNKPGVSETLRGQIKKAIDEIGFVPSATARNLAGGRTNLIGVLIPDIVSEWTSALLFGIGAGAKEYGYEVILRSTGFGIGDMEDARDLLRGIDLTDGLIIASWRVSAVVGDQVSIKGIPCVTIDGYIRSKNSFWVSTDDKQGVFNATNHLISLGHRRIGFVGGDEGAYVSRMRYTGYLDALNKAGITMDEELVTFGDYSRESGYRLGRSLLIKSSKPTAIFAGNDPIAVGVMQASYELGLSLPRDLSIIGYDGTLGEKTVPTLTTGRRDFHEMGRIAVQLLSEQIENPGICGAVKQVNLPVNLIIRQSTAPPAREWD